MIRFYVLLFVAVVSVSAPVLAKSCYSSAEAEAEQAIRIHSELMVIGLNCQHMTPRGWKNFYQQYREITNNYSRTISGYESTLISYYNQSGNGERKMHDLRTSFANETSTNSARMRPDVFCAKFSPRIPKVANMSRTEFVDWIKASASTQRLSKPLCQ